MSRENNTLLDRKIIKNRLKILKEGYASCAIEGLHITGDDKNFRHVPLKNKRNISSLIQFL